MHHAATAGRRRIGWVAAFFALVVAELTTSVFAGSMATQTQTLSDKEFVALFDALIPTLPDTHPITARPAIRGDAATDARMHDLAAAQGYRLRSEAVTLVTVNGHPMTPATAEGWIHLRKAASLNGTPLRIQSSFRSISDQQDIFLRKLGGATDADIAAGRADDVIDRALRFSSVPGTSKHHTGYALDLKTPTGTIREFVETAAYRWLSADHFAVARSLGFAPSYPAGGGDQGPNPEPWEFVFVGRAALECADTIIDVADPGPATRCPRGSHRVASDRRLLVGSGQAFDPDTDRSVTVDVIVDGTTVTSVATDPSSRAYSYEIRVRPGKHTVCARVRNNAPAGADRTVGCRSLTIRGGPHASG